jgi:4-hydroxy-3-polyprenylbenzoate decarboxylase
MPRPDLRTFLDQLERAGELVTVEREVDPHLEIAAIADRVSRAGEAGNKALLFKTVKGSRFPVLINALGSERRMNMAVGVDRKDQMEGVLGDFMARLEQPRVTLKDKLKALPLLRRLSRIFPKHRPTGPCQEVVHEGDDVDLEEIPVLTTWPEDAGPFVTMPLVFTHDPVSGARNCGMYRLQRYDKTTLGFHVHTHHTGAEHLRRTAELGREAMPVAVAVGASPQIVFSAVSPLPPGIDEMLFAGFLQGQPVEMVPCRTIDVQVPACAEFVIEGYVKPDELRREGPFGDHTGFYSLADDYHVMHVTAITHRKDAVWHTTVVGPPPQEDCWMAAAIERLFLPLQRKVMPEVLDMRMPFAGVFHNLMILRIRKEYPGQARKAAHAVWSLGQAMFTKVVVVVDEEAPPLSDDDALLQLLLDRLDVSRDVEFVMGPTETLDHASRALHYGSKVSVDLTRAFPGEGERALPPTPCPCADGDIIGGIEGLPGVVSAAVVGGGAVAVTIKKVGPAVPRVTMEQIWDWGERNDCTAVTDRVIVFDSGERLDDPVRIMWLMLAHIDPERDTRRSANPTHDASLRHRSDYHKRRIGIDATSKGSEDGFEREWPTEQVHPPELLERVASAWKEMGLSGEMPVG